MLEIGKSYLDSDKDIQYAAFDRRVVGYEGPYPIVCFVPELGGKTPYYFTEDGTAEEGGHGMSILREHRDPKVIECFMNIYESDKIAYMHVTLEEAHEYRGGLSPTTYKAVLTEVIK